MTDDDSERTRRRILTATGTGLTLGLAGCSSLGGSASSTPTATETATDTPTATAAATDTDTAEATATDEPTETEDEGPGYKSNHWHGRLFFEVNGELVDFRQSKYYLDNIEDENPDTVYFHFHEDPENHGPNEWSNEKRIVTLQRALNLIPGIGYEQQGGNHAVTYDGTTYADSESGVDVSVHRGTETVDPTSYEVQHDDNYWVQATSTNQKRQASPSHGGADLGTLVFDINNHRVDFSREKYLDVGEAFHFHDDGNPSMWYAEGAVTLQEALNSLPDISYEQSGGNHVLTYQDENHPDHSRQFDGGAAEHEVIIRQRTTPVDPTSYELQAGDIIWMYVHSSVVTDNEH